MKKIYIAANSLELGGIETSLISWIKELSKDKKLKITLMLERKEGMFLPEIPENVKIIKYKASENKNILIRKIINFTKQNIFRLIHGKRYDASICYATYSIPGQVTANIASKNSSIWMHGEYLDLWGSEEEYISQIKKIEKRGIKKIVFVSQDSMKTYNKITKKIKTRLKPLVIKNFIDGEKIIKMSEEKIESPFGKDENYITLLNAGRHEKIKNMFELLKMIKIYNDIQESEKQNLKKLRIILVGEGSQTAQLKKYGYELFGEDYDKTLVFLGKKLNPYKYYKHVDYIILTSISEGYPVVYQEAMVLHKPIITTKMPDSMYDIYKKRGIILGDETLESKSGENLARELIENLENGTLDKIKVEEFNYRDENDESLKKIYSQIF